MNLPTLQTIFTFLCFLCYGKKQNNIKLNAPTNAPVEVEEKPTMQLYTSLKQLEFISFFEMNIDNKAANNYPLEFLQELEHLSTSSKKQTFELLCNTVA